jgi:hypothetical protein
MADAKTAAPWKRKASDATGPAPLMKRQVKAAAPSTMQKAQVPKAPITKAPIAKVPPAGKPAGKAAQDIPAKAPLTKRPAVPTKATPLVRVDEAPLASPPPSPPPSPINDKPTRQGSWRDFTDVDPLYALLGELGEKKDVTKDGQIDEERLVEYLERLVVPGVCQTKSWIEVWAAMNIPVEIDTHSCVVRHIIEIGIQSEIGDTIGDVLAELVKGHRAKVKAVEDALCTTFELGCDEKDCLSRFLLLIFPKSPTSEWGWSRIGWSWKEWWAISDKVLSSLEQSSAFEVLRSILTSIETDSGTYLPHQQIWDEKRLATVRAALCRYGRLKEDELDAVVNISLS